MNIFEKSIQELQLNNVLVVLRVAGGQYDGQLLQEMVKEYRLVDLSLPVYRLQVEQNPLGFVQSLELPVYLANLHYTPSLLPVLLASGLPMDKLMASCSQSYYLQESIAKVNADQGSQAADATTMQDATGTNACANVAFMEMPLQEVKDRPAFVPELKQLAALAEIKHRTDILKAMVDGSGAWGDRNSMAVQLRKVLQQDIMEQTTCSDDIKFYRFLCTAASMAGTVINYTTLANTVGITAPTAKQWLRFLEGTGLVYLLQPVESVPGKRLMKAPKLYFRDTGVACSLLQINDSVTLLQSVYFKKLYENYVVNLLRESYVGRGMEPEWYFYRDSNAKEISIVLHHRGVVYPMSIDKDGATARKLHKSFAILEGYAAELGLELGTGVLFSSSGETEELSAGLWRVNVGGYVTGD